MELSCTVYLSINSTKNLVQFHLFQHQFYKECGPVLFIPASILQRMWSSFIYSSINSTKNVVQFQLLSSILQRMWSSFYPSINSTKNVFKFYYHQVYKECGPVFIPASSLQRMWSSFYPSIKSTKNVVQFYYHQFYKESSTVLLLFNGSLWSCHVCFLYFHFGAKKTFCLFGHFGKNVS